jgi:hypothetical protein
VTGLGISWAVVVAEALVVLVRVLVQEGGEAHDSEYKRENNQTDYIQDQQKE